MHPSMYVIVAIAAFPGMSINQPDLSHWLSWVQCHC
jgi:hypothetical protein